MDYLSKIRAETSGGTLRAELVEHPEIDGTKSEAAAKALGIPLGEILKCLLLVPERGGVPIVAILLGPDRLDLKKKFPNHRLARLEELKGVLGVGPGEVPPVFLPVPVVIDGKVLKKELVAGSAGTKFAGIKLKPEEILKGNKIAKVAEISV
ncbi:MAG: YbaK/EbsC family protein [archaeon]